MLFVNMLNSNSFTIKNKYKEIALIDYNKNDKIINNEKKLKKYISSNDKNISIILSSLKFVKTEDYPNLMILNKNYNKHLSKIIYSKVLLKNAKSNYFFNH